MTGWSRGSVSGVGTGPAAVLGQGSHAEAAHNRPVALPWRLGAECPDRSHGIVILIEGGPGPNLPDAVANFLVGLQVPSVAGAPGGTAMRVGLLKPVVISGVDLGRLFVLAGVTG